MLVRKENENEIRLCLDARSSRNSSGGLVPHESPLAPIAISWALGTSRPKPSHHGTVPFASAASASERVDRRQAFRRRILSCSSVERGDIYCHCPANCRASSWRPAVVAALGLRP